MTELELHYFYKGVIGNYFYLENTQLIVARIGSKSIKCIYCGKPIVAAKIKSIIVDALIETTYPSQTVSKKYSLFYQWKHIPLKHEHSSYCGGKDVIYLASPGNRSINKSLESSIGNAARYLL